MERLQEERSINEDRLYDSDKEDVQGLIQMTRAFMSYLDDYDLKQAGIFKMDNRFVKRESLVLAGRQIFDILFHGTKCKPINNNCV